MTKPVDNIVIYQADDSQSQVEVRLRDETVWLSQAQMADLKRHSVSHLGQSGAQAIFSTRLCAQ